jgi:hypothetical protein
VQTAWEEIFQRLDAPCIYEFDLMGFFDNVDLGFISKALGSAYHLPASEVEFFERLNQSVVIPASEDLLPEPDRAVLYNSDGGVSPMVRSEDVD